MPKPNPVSAGFAEPFRNPSLIAAEISWRWCFGAAFWALVVLSLFEYLHSLVVDPLDWMMWKSGIVPLMGQAIGEVVKGSGYKLLRIAAILLPGLTLLWTTAASFGRATTLQVLVPGYRARFRTLFALSFVRAVAAIAGVAAFIGVYVIAAGAYVNAPGKLPHSDRAMAILILAGAAVGLAWLALNCLLTFAPVMAATGRDAGSALSEAVRMFAARPLAFLGVFVVTGVVHAALFLGFGYFGMFVLAFAAVLPGKVFMGLVVLIGLLYSALVDWLHVTRLAGYAGIVRDEEEVPGTEGPVAYAFRPSNPLPSPQSAR